MNKPLYPQVCNEEGVDREALSRFVNTGLLFRKLKYQRGNVFQLFLFLPATIVVVETYHYKKWFKKRKKRAPADSLVKNYCLFCFEVRLQGITHITPHNPSADVNEVAVKETIITLCCPAYVWLFCWRDVWYKALSVAMERQEQEAQGTRGPDQTCKYFMGAQETNVCVCD